LHLAVEEGHRRIAQLLLEHYADSNVRNDYGETPLHAAVARNDAGMVDLLLRFKADPQTRDSVVMFTQYHQTPEMMALAEGHTGLTRLFHKPEVVVKSPGKPPAWPIKSPSFASSGRSTTITPYSARSRSNSGERSVYEQLGDLQELSQGIVAALSTCDSDRTLPSEGPKQDLSREEKSPAAPTESLSMEEIQLAKWLYGLQLAHLLDTFRAAGQTSLPQLISQHAFLTLEDVLDMGVELPGEAIVFLAALELEAKHVSSSGLCGLCHSYEPARTLLSMSSLYDWLRALGLEAEYTAFTTVGFTSLEQLLAITHTRFALSDDSLQNIVNIRKLGHRHRILNRLMDDAQGIDPYMLLLGSTGLRLERHSAPCSIM